MGLLMISRGLHLGAAILANDIQVPTHTAREGECFYRRKKEIAKVIVKKGTHGFSYLSPWQEQEEYFLFLLGSAILPECV